MLVPPESIQSVRSSIDQYTLKFLNVKVLGTIYTGGPPAGLVAASSPSSSITGPHGPPHPGHQPVAGLILASGMSRRFGGDNKLLMPVDGVPVVRRSVQAFLDAGLRPVLVVVGYQGERVTAVLDGMTVTVVPNPDFVAGQSRALVRGVRALSPTVSAAVIGVGDQPLLTGDVVRRLVAVFREQAAPLVVPRYAGRRGNPVLFSSSLFGELLEVVGDQGGRGVIERHRDQVAWVDVPEGLIGVDVDSLEDYLRLRDV